MSVTVETDAVSGPASYPTGGWVVTTGLSSVNAFLLGISDPGANLPAIRFEVARNTPSAGQVTIKAVRSVYDKTDAIAAMSGLPSGVSSASSSGQTYDPESAHVHSMAHDHAATVSDGPINGTQGVSTALGSGSYSAHTHSFDPPNFTGNTGAGGSHNHAWNVIYEHGHATTNTETDMSVSELPNGTDISGATLNYIAVGP